MLVVFQFALAIAFMIGTVMLFAQMHHVRQTNLGFDREGLIVVSVMTDCGLIPANRASLMAAFHEMPNAINAALGSPVAAAGAYVTGFIGNWTVSADFVSVANVLLGTVNVSGSNTNYVFVGFSGEGIDIGRVQFRDVSNNGGNMGVDDFVTNSLAVPEPASWVMMLVGFGMIGGIARYRRRTATIAYT